MYSGQRSGRRVDKKYRNLSPVYLTDGPSNTLFGFPLSVSGQGSGLRRVGDQWFGVKVKGLLRVKYSMMRLKGERKFFSVEISKFGFLNWTHSGAAPL